MHHQHPSGTSAAEPREADETTFTLPKAWHSHLDPWRGGPAVPIAPVDTGAADAARSYVEKRLASWRENLRGAPELLEAGRAQLRGEVSPLGAAVVTAVVTAKPPWEEWHQFGMFADAWVAEHGLVFAAVATAELGGILVDAKKMPRAVRPRRDDDQQWDGWVAGECIAQRVRALLAAADERTYQEAVEALAHCRRARFQQAVVCYLVPTQTGWVDELCAAPTIPQDGYPSLLLRSLSSAAQFTAFRAQDGRWWHLGSDDTVHTALASVGPDLAPALADLLDGMYRDRGYSRELYAALAAIPTDEAFDLLLARLDRPFAHAAAFEAMERYPVRALRLLGAAAAATASPTAEYAAALLHRHVRAHPELPGAAIPQSPWIEDAPAESLPRLLVEPPWTCRRRTAKRTVVKDLTPPAGAALLWAPGEEQEWAEADAPHRRWEESTDWAKAVTQFRNGKTPRNLQPGLFLDGPEDDVRPLLAQWQPGRMSWRWDSPWMQQIVTRFGADALPAVLALARSDSAALGELLLPFTGVEVALQMAEWLGARRKNVRPVVHAWLRRHADAAARDLVPAAVGRAKGRRHAEAALRFLVSQGHTETVRAAARGYGDKAAAAIEAFLAADPLDAVPAQIPDDFFLLDVHLLPRILLRDRRYALPPSAARHLVTMLAISKPDEPYAGIEVVKELCDPESLAEFGWGLFQQETSYAGGVKADDWTLTALGRLGDNETVRRLTPLIRSWPGDGGHAASVAGLQVLATIGTDVALTHLHGIAQKAKYQGIKKKAQEKMAEVAGELGLTPDELADRVVPDLDLDASGAMTLDYGRRRFTIGFDEQLRPYVADEDGKRLKTLPKPGVRDDQELAPAAHKRFAALKKDLRTVSADQIRRLEQAMVAQRRWTATEFRELIVGHPLLWHLARRLVWLTGDGRSFRLAEDRTLADVHDDTLTLQDTARVGVAHPLHLADTLDDWRELFADYEILQPFAQLDRPAHPLTDDERAATELRRFHGITVPVGKVLGMERRGWVRGSAEDNGIQFCIFQPLPEGREAVIDLDPGIAVGLLDHWPEQRIAGVRLAGPELTRRARGTEIRPLAFGALDPITASEILASLVELTD
ncbi:DUF4132 domain-containing protein [Streptomyces sp. NPDC048483]|uniref:DUF4132 domain-containing protein n=1 Tax=Streptomyces sp. NPDC048483 TaxID=3154927 RepID=UPI00343F66E0